MHLPVWFLLMIAKILSVLTALTGKKFKLNEFTVKMLVINRYFDISNIMKDIGYKPIITFEQGWSDTIHWFRNCWMTRKTKFSAQPPPMMKT